MRLLAIVVFIVCLMATMGATYRFINTVGLLDQVKIVEMSANDLLVALLNAETSQRGYIITNDPRYLIPYRSALARIDTALAALGAAALHDPAQAAHVADIVVLASEKVDELASTLAIRDERGLIAASDEVKKHLDVNLMDSLRLHFDAVGLLSETRFALYETNGACDGRIAMLAMVITVLSGSFLIFRERR